MKRTNRDSLPGEFDPVRIAEAVGAHLQALRRERRIKQDVLADALGVSRTTASNIERGRQRLSIDQLYRAAAFIGLPVAALLPTLETARRPVFVLTASDDPLPPDAMGSLLYAIDELAAKAKRPKGRAGRKALPKRRRMRA